MATVKSTLTSVTLALAALVSSAFAAAIPDGMQWGVTREQVRARDFTIRGKKAEAVFRRWATR